MRTRIAAITLSLLVSSTAFGQDDLSLAAISQRHTVVRMSDAELVDCAPKGSASRASRR